MPRPRRDPYVAVDATIRSNAKLAALPSDTARLGWIYVGLGQAKLQRPSGRFAGRQHWDEVAGRFARYLAEYLAVGLLEAAPGLCDRCRTAWGSLPSGTLVVHDWKHHQTDPGAADRAAIWRGEPEPEQTVIERYANDEQTVIERSLPSGRVRSRGTPRGESEGESERDTAPTKPRRRSRASAAGEPDLDIRLTKDQVEAWATFGAEWSGFKTAWLQKGLRMPPAGAPDDDDTSQRGLLYQILDSRPSDLVTWVSEAPGGSARKVIDHVLVCWHAQRDAAVDDDGGPTWMRDKADEQRDAPAALAAVLGRQS